MYNRYISLNEASTYESLYSNEDIIEKLGDVDVYDYEKKTILIVFIYILSLLFLRQYTPHHYIAHKIVLVSPL